MNFNRYTSLESNPDGTLVEEDFDLVEQERKQREMEKKHGEAKEAWKHFTDNLGKDDFKKFLSVR